MESIVSNQPPVSFKADREHDQSQNGWIEPRICSGLNAACASPPNFFRSVLLLVVVFGDAGEGAGGGGAAARADRWKVKRTEKPAHVRGSPRTMKGARMMTLKKDKSIAVGYHRH